MATRQTPVTYVNNSVLSSYSTIYGLSTSYASSFSSSNLLVSRSIGYNCNSPNYPVDIRATGTAYAGNYAQQITDSGLLINASQLGQIKVVSAGAVNEAELVLDSGASGGPLTAYGSGNVTRGAYIFATAGDAINIAKTGQVSICNAGVAQTNYSLYVGGNTAIKGSTIITNGLFQLANSTVGYALMNSTILSMSTCQFDLSNTTVNMRDGSFTQSNTSLQYHDLYSTSLRVFNSAVLQSNLAQQTAQYFCTNMTIYGGDFTISSLTTNLRSATLNNTNLVVNSGNTTLRSTLTISNSAGTIAANLYSTNLSVYGGNFLHSNGASATATANFYSTTVGIYGGNLLMSNSGSETANAAFYSTNMTIYNGLLTLQPPVAKTANFYSTSLDLYGNLTVYGTVTNRGDTTTYIADKSSTSATYANAATVGFSNFSGMILINNVGATGTSVIWLCGGGAAAQIGASGAGGGTGTVSYSAGISGYTWSNNTGSSQNIVFALIRTRTEG